MIYDQKLEALDPLRVAMLSGITKFQRATYLVPPIVRPFLLTEQLRGCCSCRNGGMAVPPDYGAKSLHKIGLGKIGDYIRNIVHPVLGVSVGVNPGETDDEAIARYNATVLGYTPVLPPTISPTAKIFPSTVPNTDGSFVGPIDPNAFVGPIDPNTFDMSALQVPSMGSGNTSVLQTLAVGANFIPGIGQIASIAISTFTQFLSQFQTWFHIGAGRREADIIVPVQIRS